MYGLQTVPLISVTVLCIVCQNVVGVLSLCQSFSSYVDFMMTWMLPCFSKCMFASVNSNGMRKTQSDAYLLDIRVGNLFSLPLRSGCSSDVSSWK